MILFAKSLQFSLIYRDVFILDVLGNPGALEEYVNNPYTQESVHMLTNILDNVFNNPDYKPDMTRLARAIKLCEYTDTVIGGGSVQACATGAYLNWVAGKPQEATTLAQKAVMSDSNATLAKIVLAAVENNIMPAWMEQQ